MPFSKPTLKQAILDAFAAAYANTTDKDVAANAVATAISDAIAVEVKSCIETAVITYSAGLIAPSGGGPVTGVFTNTIEATAT